MRVARPLMDPLLRRAADNLLALVISVGVCYSHVSLAGVGSPALKELISGDLVWLYDDFQVIGPESLDADECSKRVPPLAFKPPNIEVACYSFRYQVTDFSPHALLLRSQAKRIGNRRKLVVYNHGHGGLPNDHEPYAHRFLTELLTYGVDILLVSMPFTGIDVAHTPVKIKTWDGWATLDPGLLVENPAMQHGVFETLDTGRSHYIRIFIDSAVMSVVALRKSYDDFFYVGLSGGATVGLYTCSLLTRLVDACFLMSGVMPLSPRLTVNNLGDAEQHSSGFHNNVSTLGLIKDIHGSSTSLFLSYNSDDPCCFDGDSARRLKDDLDELGISEILTIRESAQHDYDAELLANTIIRWPGKPNRQ